jgi:hypothetical protein
MTDKEIDQLAELMANKVMNKLIVKQQEWDQQFNDQLDQMKNEDHFEGIVPAVTKKINLERKIEKLKELRNSYIINEQYELLSDVEVKLIKLEKELFNL